MKLYGNVGFITCITENTKLNLVQINLIVLMYHFMWKNVYVKPFSSEIVLFSPAVLLQYL